MKKNALLLLLFLTIGLSHAQTYTVETVPNTKLVNNSYVSNPDSILSDVAVDKINGTLSSLEKQTTVQVAVVVIKSIGDADIFDFAEKLFERWGIGHAAKDNGLLILMVLDQRTVRFSTGYGLEGVLPDIICKHIQMEQMVPQFKVEDYNAGMIAGVGEVAYILSNPAYADELRDESRKETNGWYLFFAIALILGGLAFLIWLLGLHLSGSFSDSKKKRKSKDLYPEMRLKRLEWIIEFGVIPFSLLVAFNFIVIDTDNHVLIFLAILYLYFVMTLVHKRIRMGKVVDRLMAKKDYYATVEFFSSYQGFWLFTAILFPVPMLFHFFQYLSRKKFYRNHPRDCKMCGMALQKLDEKADDLYLTKKQVKEEELGSVDYDVWVCSKCQMTEEWNYVNRFSKYKPCPKCNTRAFFKESDRTLTSATYTSTGTGQITERCKFCDYVDISTYTIAKLTPPSSSSGSSGSSNSSSGSWGGGSSGGGGASSSW